MHNSLLAFCVLLPCVPCISYGEGWKPPENPDPQAILWEAKADAQAGRYEVALAKQVWYHDNAIRLAPSQSAVRLSFGLSNWLELGEKFPPALAKMKQVRDEVEMRVRDKDQVRVKFDDFHEFVAFNRTLREDQRTVELFKWLDETDDEDAARMFHVAKPALVIRKQYELCGKYIDPEADMTRLGDSYKRGLKFAEEQFGEMHRKFVENTFLNSATTLVALLAHNDRKAEAEKAAAAARKLLKDNDLQEKLDEQLKSALKGIVPKPWP